MGPPINLYAAGAVMQISQFSSAASVPERGRPAGRPGPSSLGLFRVCQMSSFIYIYILNIFKNHFCSFVSL